MLSEDLNINLTENEHNLARDGQDAETVFSEVTGYPKAGKRARVVVPSEEASGWEGVYRAKTRLYEGVKDPHVRCEKLRQDFGYNLRLIGLLKEKAREQRSSLKKTKAALLEKDFALAQLKRSFEKTTANKDKALRRAVGEKDETVGRLNGEVKELRRENETLEKTNAELENKLAAAQRKLAATQTSLAEKDEETVRLVQSVKKSERRYVEKIRRFADNCRTKLERLKLRLANSLRQSTSVSVAADSQALTAELRQLLRDTLLLKTGSDKHKDQDSYYQLLEESESEPLSERVHKEGALFNKVDELGRRTEELGNKLDSLVANKFQWVCCTLK